jgi:type I site-specific restriction endonuclease
VGKDLDPFDLICHVAFDQPPLTRRERAENVRKRDVFTKYGKQARAELEALLQKYQDEGVTDLDAGFWVTARAAFGRAPLFNLPADGVEYRGGRVFPGWWPATVARRQGPGRT